jgi:muramoyltetrapeptide carboxypeptidase
MANAVKPSALHPGDAIRVIASASPVDAERLRAGIAEIEKLGFVARHNPRLLERDGFFAGSAESRRGELMDSLREPDTRAIFCARGGYGSGYLIDQSADWNSFRGLEPKLFVGYSDVTLLQVFFWQKFGWVSLYGPMVAAGFDHGPGAAHGYDAASFAHAISGTQHGWNIDLAGEMLAPGRAEGVLLGGCLTLVEMTLGTPWELDARGAILLLEDRGMKPWQVDRALLHLCQAGKLSEIRGIVFGDFPDCEPPAGTETVRDVAARVCGPLKIPVVWGAPFGHTARPMLTIPLGVQARLISEGAGRIEILEPACRE